MFLLGKVLLGKDFLVKVEWGAVGKIERHGILFLKGVLKVH